MGGLRSIRRKLNRHSVNRAKRVELKKHELAMNMVAERVKIDAEFAADVLKIGGEQLRKDIKKSAQETIAKAQQEKDLPLGGDRTHELVPEQTDGGGEILVEPTEKLDYPRDGECPHCKD